MRGLFGTNAPFFADVTLLLSMLVAVLLTVGFVLARRRQYTAHRWVQTAAVVLNTGLVFTVMFGSFGAGAASGIPARLGEAYYAIAALHGAAGLIALVFGVYVMLRGHGLVPRFLQFANYKPYMRGAYGLYMLASVLGVVLYVIWYTAPPRVTDLATVVQQDGEVIVPMVDFSYSPTRIVVPTGATVVWVNQDGAPHNALADDGSWGFELIGNGERATTVFDTLGTFPFYCELHGAPGGIDMAGVVEVVPADTALAAALPAPSGVAPPITALLNDGPDLPARQGYAAGIRIQAAALNEHTRLLNAAFVAGDLEATQRHAEHVHNLIVGAFAPTFGDLNGDGRSQNPGDGFGLLANDPQPGYIDAVAVATQSANAASDATDAIRLHASHVLIAAANLRGWANEAAELSLALVREQPNAERVSALNALAAAIAVGVDLNGDGQVAPVPGEGGALVAYEHALYMAGLAP